VRRVLHDFKGRVVLAVICAVTLGAFVTPAGAATSITFHRTSLVAAVGPTTIICSLSIDNAHPSSHVVGQVNIVSHVNCTSVVDTISLDTKLIRSGITVGTGHSDSIFGAPFVNGQANATCLNASYGGSAHALIHPPLGYTPTSGQGDVIATVVSVTCP
jgi:hypothetical protein